MDFTQIDGSPIANFCRSIILVLNMLIFAVQVPISSMNIFAIFRTQILHPNLKCILLAQSCCFCAWTMVHSINIYNIFVLGPTHWLDGTILMALVVFTIQFGNFVGHPLLIERTLATLMAKQYENWKTPLFSIGWALPIIVICAANAYQQAIGQDGPSRVMNFTLGTLVAHFVTTAMSLAEIFLFSILSVHNLKRYKAVLNNDGAHSLSERYQLAENIRTARQLAPTVMLHFLNIFVSMIVVILFFFGIVTNPIWASLIALGYQFYFSLLNMMVEYTLISRHPILRQNVEKQWVLFKNAILYCVKLPGNNRVSSTVATNYNWPQIDGNNLSDRNAQERHFQMLQMEWN